MLSYPRVAACVADTYDLLEEYGNFYTAVHEGPVYGSQGPKTGLLNRNPGSNRNFPNCSSYKIMARTDLRARITAAIHAIESGECADYTEAALKYGVDRTTIPASSSALAGLKHTSPKSPELSIRSVSGRALSPFYS